jgi:hypothetical protein
MMEPVLGGNETQEMTGNGETLSPVAGIDNRQLYLPSEVIEA